MTKMFRTILTTLMPTGGLVLLCASVMGQTPAPSPKLLAPQVRVAVKPGERRAAPQVVTIVHRLNGLKIFRLLLRSEQQPQAIDRLDSPFDLLDDVHTNVSAGVAMEDGETIAAWLPDVAMEFQTPAIPERFKVKVPGFAEMPARDFKTNFETPDVSVIGPDGKQLMATYVGLDATTGLSILKLASKGLFSPTALNDEPLGVGANVVLFGPEPAPPAPAVPVAAGNSLYVRVGAINGRIDNVLPAPSGEVARVKVSAANLSLANIGAVAVNENGVTIGIVDGLEDHDATVLPVASIRRAAQRVLEQQASVPRPWLGVKGEAISTLKLDQIRSQGWTMDRAADLAEKHRGIMLTSIVPDSPAARADLRAGDVILKVDDKEIQKAEDFTWWLDQAGPSSSVQFTVARPDRPAEEALNVKLSGSLGPWANFSVRNGLVQTKGWSLLEHGIETIALKPGVATQLGTTAGLLVVYVEPGTAAFAAGLKAGDVIQSIDGTLVSALDRTAPPKTLSTLDVVRKKEKLTLTLAKPVKNQ